MASLDETPPLSLRNGFRCVPEDNATVEDVLIEVGDQIGHENIVSASRMNQAVVVFLKEPNLVNRLIVSGLTVKDAFVQLSPLYTLTTKVTVSNIPPFVSNDVVQRELVRFGKIVSPFKTVALGCKHPALKHVASFRRYVYMVLESPENTLDINFRVKHEGRLYMVYATTGSIRCFECGDIGHKRLTCPHKKTGAENAVGSEDGVANKSADLVDAAQDEAVPLAEVSDANSDVALMAVDTENNVDVAKVVPKSSVNGLVSVVNTDEVASTSGTKQLESANDGNEEISYLGVLNNEDVEEELSDDTESQVSMCENDGSSQGLAFNASQVDFSGGFNKDSLYNLEQINSFLDETYGKQININDFFPDIDKFVQSVMFYQRTVGVDELSEKKRFRLKKHLTTIRKSKAMNRRKNKLK